MKIPAGSSLTYVVSHEAWYAQIGDQKLVGRPNVMIQASASGGGVHWEFVAEEVELSRSQPSIKLKIFDDAFVAFEQIPEFFFALAAGNNWTLDKVIRALEMLGARDVTERQKPEPVRTRS